jgi:colicin import membrane protein
MNQRSPSAYFLSAFLHAFVVALLVVLAYMARKKPDEEPHIFELVAGEGDNYAATEAPAAGVPDAPKIEMPPVIKPEPRPAPPDPVIVPTPPPPPPKAAPQPVPTPPKIEPKVVPKPPPKKAPEPPKPAPKPMTKEEFDRLNPQKKTAAPKDPRPITTKKIDVAGIAKGLTAGSTTITVGSGGTSLTRAESDLLDAYAQLILQRIREALERAGLSDMLEVRVEFRVAANGAISGARAVSSSGSREFDQAVLAAFRSVRPVGPPPTNRPEAFVVNVRMREL